MTAHFNRFAAPMDRVAVRMDVAKILNISSKNRGGSIYGLRFALRDKKYDLARVDALCANDIRPTL